ncbi:MAG TPA: Tad domain-containing protein [Candidatus Limnocylindrales bacterium]|nr:Tad domain-containing protein [Candidatus Limnocylindrales bacterium]
MPQDRGQVLVIFALAITVLFGAAGLAFDIGRFYSERRFLQNAADAAALAAASALIRGESTTQADARARESLAINFGRSPSGVRPSPPPTTPEYADGHAGDPVWLTNGILFSGGEVRVAVQNSVDYTFGRVVGLDRNRILGQARVRTNGDLLPIAVRHYLNSPGPNTVWTAPCTVTSTDFQDLMATEDTGCLGTATNGSLRTMPSTVSSTETHDPSRHGPIIAIVGDDAKPSNNASFRGFVSLDIRNFQYDTPPSTVYYNGVTPGTPPNDLKDIESGWVANGYPGPAFPPATTPPDPNDQVGLMDGNSAGLIVDEMAERYKVGDEILCAVYSGTTMTIPDFSLTVPSSVSINSSQNRDGSVTMSLGANAAFGNSQVTSSAFTDWGDPTNPMTLGTLLPITFAPNPIGAPASITWTTFTTSGAAKGIYTFWVQGHSPSPYLKDHYYPVALNVAGVNRDFTSNGNGKLFSMETTGSTASGAIAFSTPNKGGTYFGGSVHLSIEGGPGDGGVLPTGLGAVTFSTNDFTLNQGQVVPVDISINGGTLGPGVYPLTIRATGTNSGGDVVTHLVPITLSIATALSSTEYVDIEGFAVFRIAEINSNNVMAYAITGVHADMNDPALRRGQVARLVPWN